MTSISLKELEMILKKEQVIVFGEVHGTKETPEMLTHALSKLAEYGGFNLCLEIPKEFEKQPEKFFAQSLGDGRNSLEYLRLVHQLGSYEGVRIFFVEEDTGKGTKDENLANRVADIVACGGKTVIILGNMHARKKPLKFGSTEIIPAGYLLEKRLKKEVMSIALVPSRGMYYNHGIKKITEISLPEHANGFDHIFVLGEVSPASFN